MRILVVDDEIEILEDISSMIAQKFPDCDIIRTSISREALGVLQTEIIDILLTDINMPGINGLRLAEASKINNEQCRIIFLTGYSMFEYAYDALKIGCIDFILKINSEQEICAALEKAIAEICEQNALADRDTRGGDITPELNEPECETDAIAFTERYINEHISGEITLSSLSKAVYLSPAYLSRLFKAKTRSTINEYVTYVRISRSKHMLIHSNEKIQDIAKGIGIDSPVYFSRLFKKETGYTPQQYRMHFYGKNA